MSNRNIPIEDPQKDPLKDLPKEPLKDYPKVVTHRLSVEALEELEKQLTPPDCNNSTTPTHVAYQLGIQKALNVLRRGFVIGA